MKKIILIILMFFCLMCNVSAKETYYSDYGNFSEYSSEKINSTELIKVDVERRYKFYANERVGEYRRVIDDNYQFKYVDKGNRREGEYSNWTEEIPESVEERIIEVESLYYIRRPKPIKIFYIVNSGSTDITVKDIKIYYKGEELRYWLSSQFTSENYTIHSGGSLKLELKKYYSLEDITIKIGEAKFDETNELHISATVPSEDNLYYISYFRVNLDNSYQKNILIDSSYWISTNTQYEYETIEERDPNENLSIVRKESLYRYQDPLFYFYNLEKIYVDGYFKEYLGLIKDESDYIDLYRYQVRDKCEFADEIRITDYSQTISDFINCTTDYQMKTNLNIYENGVYKVEFTNSFMNIKKDVIVDIKLNGELDKPVEDSKEESDEIYNKYEQSLKEIDDLKSNNNILKNKNNKLVNKNNNLNNKFTNLLNDYELLEQNLTIKELECKVCDSKLKNNMDKEVNLNIIDKSNIYCIVLIVLLFILLLIVLKKLSDKNKF